MALELIAPAKIIELSKAVMGPLHEAAAGTSEEVGALLNAVGALVMEMRRDLVPKNLR